MDNSTAYHIGQIFGAIMAIVVILGACVFFVIALVQAIRTRRKGWIIAASISGLPAAVFFVLVMVGIGVGVWRARQSFGAGGPHNLTTQQKISAEMLTAAMTPVTGRATVPYSISLPWLSEWKKNTERPPYDYLFSYRDLYIGTIVEGIGLGTTQKVCDFTQKNMRDKAALCEFSEPQPVEIDKKQWLRYDATTKVQNFDIKYRVFVYADRERTVQIMSWTGPKLFDQYAPAIDRIAKSFKFGDS